ncbi:hypothetical protein C0V76_06135 [Uliginosibacterium sp. TH139]|nr:hypothetical protein C0V76_06135 [Uliginosibacterium sp. TH139]
MEVFRSAQIKLVVADMKNILKLVATVLIALSFSGSLHAEDNAILGFFSDLNRSKEPLDWAIASGFQSKHMVDDPSYEYNENNKGIGFRTPGGWTAGGYYNSIRRYSVYAGREYQWRLFGPDWMRLHAGVVLGGVSGYEDGIQIGGVEHGIHLAVLPELVLRMPYLEAALIYIPSASKTPATLAGQLRIAF